MRLGLLTLALVLASSAVRADTSAPAPSASTTSLSFSDLASLATPSVVLLTLYSEDGTKQGTGSGFFISATGQIATNHHVIDDAERVVAKLSDGREVKIVGLLADDPKNDLAIVQAEGAGYQPLPLGDPGSVRVGDEIAVIGSPLGLSTTLSTGILAAVRDKGLGRDESLVDSSSWTMHITAAVAPGSSGSPILSRRGEVVGVVVGGISSAEGMHFGIRVEALRELATRVQPAPRPFAARVAPDARLRNLGISAGLAFAVLGGYMFFSRRSEKAASARRPARR